MKALLIFTLLCINPSLVIGAGLGTVYNFLTSIFNPSNYAGGGSNEPSISSPIPNLYANLTTNVCDPQVYSCPKTRYRSINGSCNNLANPGWGTPNTTYLRILKNNYADGLFALPKAKNGEDLPNVREVSIKLFPDVETNDKELNLNGMQWGQIITHDMSLLQSPSGQIAAKLVCCKDGKLTKEASTNEFCAPVIIPYNDPIHKPGSCLDFSRADTDRNIGCVPKNQGANQLTMVTAFMDASITYGSTEEQSAAVRSFENGNLRTVTRRGREWPPQVKNVTQSCSGAESPKEPCYLGGDSRINQNTELTLLQVLLLHFHNYIADYLSEINPQWNDEKIFQESRRIVVAVIQNINFYEYLPYFLGKQNMLENKLIYNRTNNNMGDYINDYNPDITPGVINEHATAAWRYFHTLIQNYLKACTEKRVCPYQFRLSDWFNRPLVLEEDNNYDDLVYGFTTQPSSVADPWFAVEITEYLFRGKNKFGGDLRSVDVQRNRDAGLGTYVKARAACKLSVPKTWNDLRGIISESFIQKLKQLYDDVCDIDLTVGGSLESHVPGARAGPTFLTIMLTQFLIIRKGDRFWYENGSDKTIRFTNAQLANIRNMTMASFLCASSEAGNMQKRAFEVITLKNPVVSCDDIPSLDLNLWKEDSKLSDEEVEEEYEGCGKEDNEEGYGEKEGGDSDKDKEEGQGYKEKEGGESY